MSDFVSKYKNSVRGLSKKSQNKEDKKSVTKALHETLQNAMNGQLAGIQYQGKMYLMASQELFNELVQSGGKMLITEEQQEFHKNYQLLLHMMNGMDIEVPEEGMLHDELDQFTFDFSQYMNDPKGEKKRREITEEFKELISKHTLLQDMEVNLRAQLFQENPPEVENNGKLT